MSPAAESGSRAAAEVSLGVVCCSVSGEGRAGAIEAEGCRLGPVFRDRRALFTFTRIGGSLMPRTRSPLWSVPSDRTGARVVGETGVDGRWDGRRCASDQAQWRTASLAAETRPAPVQIHRTHSENRAEEAIHRELQGRNAVTPRTSCQVRAPLGSSPPSRGLDTPRFFIGSSQVFGPRRHVPPSRLMRRGPTRVVGEAGSSASGGASAQAGCRAALPAHRPLPSRGARR